MTIYFVVRETEYGPFFTAYEKAVDYLKDQGDWDENIRTNRNPHIVVEEVVLDSEGFIFDG